MGKDRTVIEAMNKTATTIGDMLPLRHTYIEVKEKHLWSKFKKKVRIESQRWRICSLEEN